MSFKNTNMIKLSLDFPNEKLMPSNLIEFEEVINNYEFNYWFKVIWKKIIPLSSYNKDKIIDNKLSYSFSYIWWVFEKLLEKNIKENYYVVNNKWKFDFYIDSTINEKTTLQYIGNNYNIIVQNILDNIFWEILHDVYLDKIIEEYLEETVWIKDRVSQILSIKSKWKYIKVKFEEYLEANWWNPEDIEYVKYGWAFVTKTQKIKKRDLH